MALGFLFISAYTMDNPGAKNQEDSRYAYYNALQKHLYKHERSPAREALWNILLTT